MSEPAKDFVISGMPACTNQPRSHTIYVPPLLVCLPRSRTSWHIQEITDERQWLGTWWKAQLASIPQPGDEEKEDNGYQYKQRDLKDAHYAARAELEVDNG